MRQSRESVGQYLRNSWENPHRVLRKSWESPEKVLRKSWIIPPKFLRMSWQSSERVLIKSGECPDHRPALAATLAGVVYFHVATSLFTVRLLPSVHKYTITGSQVLRFYLSTVYSQWFSLLPFFHVLTKFAHFQSSDQQSLTFRLISFLLVET